jgi:nucleoside-diphosphate-sugar epimerase
MSIVAVIGTGTPIGGAVLARLQADPDVETILGIDADEPEMPPSKLDFRTADLREPLSPDLFDQPDVVVHCGLELEPLPDEDETFARVVHGTRILLDAAEKAGTRAVVVVTSAAVYGARPDTPLPLDEDAALRVSPEFGVAYALRLVEQMVAEWADGHPGVAVTVLRPAVILTADGWMSRHLLSPRLPLIGGQSAPLQLVHPDDVAAAVHLAVTGRVAGVYNVAADGWLPVTEVAGVLGRRTVRVPEATAFSAVRWLWSRSLWHLPPGALPVLMYPLVVSTDKLRAAGWAPSASNRELLRRFAAQHRHEVAVGRLRTRRRTLYRLSALGFAGAGLSLWLGTRLALRWVRS